MAEVRKRYFALVFCPNILPSTAHDAPCLVNTTIKFVGIFSLLVLKFITKKLEGRNVKNMKNRKIFIVLLAFLALLMIGVGFAAITESLNIGGSANTIDDDQLKEEYLLVQFKKDVFETSLYNIPVSATDNSITYSDTTEHSEGEIKNMQCSVDVSMTTKGSYVEYTNYIINNSEEYKVNLSTVVDLPTGMENYYKVTVTLAKNALNEKVGGTVDETLVTIRIEMIKTPTYESEADTEIIVTFTAEAKELN